MKTNLRYLASLVLVVLFMSCSSGGNLAGTPKVKSVISSTRWIHVKTIDAVTKEDVTSKYPQFTGIGQYNADGTYAFFTADNKPKGDKGNWSLTDDNTAIKITSSTFGYTVSPQLVLGNASHLDFRITVRDNTGKAMGEVIVFHIPYKDK